jgi:hypothetical protein
MFRGRRGGYIRRRRESRVGFACDATKYGGGAQLFDKLKAVEATESRVAVFWDPTQPDTIQEKPFLDRMLPAPFIVSPR